MIDATKVDVTTVEITMVEVTMVDVDMIDATTKISIYAYIWVSFCRAGKMAV